MFNPSLYNSLYYQTEGFANTVQILTGKFEPECAQPFYVVMTHHTAMANLEKGS